MSDLLVGMYEDFDKIIDKAGIEEFITKYHFIIKNTEDMVQFLLQYIEYRREMI